MSRLTRPATVGAGILLIVVVNLALLGAAAWNQRGAPLSALVLTERELALPLDRQETSAGIVLSLRLANRAPGLLQRAAWTRRTKLHRMDLPWFDTKKLLTLGFPIDVAAHESGAALHYNNAQFKRVYVALEYDGEAWKRWISDRADKLEQLRRSVEAGSAGAEELTDREAQLAFDRVARSRLVPIDVERSATELRSRYPDGRRYLVLPGLVRPVVHDPDDGPRVIRGDVSDLLVQWIPVPRRHRGLLDPLMPTEKNATRRTREREQAREGWPAPTPPRYGAVLAVGRNHAPWLSDVRAPDPAAGNEN